MFKNLMKIEFWWRQIFNISIIHKPTLGSPIGSALLTFIGYKQTDKQTDRQAKFIYRYVYITGEGGLDRKVVDGGGEGSLALGNHYLL